MRTWGLSTMRGGKIWMPMALAAGMAAVPASAATINTQWMTGYIGNEADTVLFWNFEGETDAQHLADKSGQDLHADLRDDSAQLVSEGRFGDGALLINKPAVTGSGPTGAQSPVNMNHASFMGASASAFSVEFWYRPAAITGDVYLVDNKADAHNNGISLRRMASGGLDVRFGNGDASHTTVSSVLEWSVDQWYHVAVTFENLGDASELRIWRDGEEVGGDSVAGFGDLTFRSFRFVLGDRAYSTGTNGSGDGEGLYDEVRVSTAAYQFVIPEPATAAMGGLGALLCLRRSRRQA